MVFPSALRLDIAIDSGAFTSALPTAVAADYPLKPLDAGERSTTRTANGEEIAITGKKQIKVSFQKHMEWWEYTTKRWKLGKELTAEEPRDWTQMLKMCVRDVTAKMLGP